MCILINENNMILNCIKVFEKIKCFQNFYYKLLDLVITYKVCNYYKYIIMLLCVAVIGRWLRYLRHK